MAITEAEKRKLLRERRAAKMANSSARLSQITGDAVEEPVEESMKPEIATPVTQPITVASSAVNKKNNRISQNFQDPPMQDIDSVEAEEFQKTLQQLLGSVKHDHEGNSGPTELNDMFAQMLKIPGMPQPGAQGEQGEQVPDEEFEKLQELKRANDQYKARFMCVKLILVVVYTLYFIFFNGFKSSSFAIQQQGNYTSFIQMFTAFEVLTTSIYATHLIKTPENHYNYHKALGYLDYIPHQFVSAAWKNRVKLGVKYLELLQLTLFDVSIVVVLFGVTSILNEVALNTE